jgi:hypothetical protein
MEYNPAIYNSLLDVEVANSSMNKDKDDRLVKMRALMAKHNVAGLAAVQLLHRHFDLESNERLAERVYYDPDQVVSEAVDQSVEMIPHMWKLSSEKVQNEDGKEEKTQLVWRPCEWIRLDIVDKKDNSQLAQIQRGRLSNVQAQFDKLSKESDFLQQYGDLLISEKLTEFCGLALVTPDSLPFHEDYLPVESIDFKGRKLVVERKERKQLDMKDVIETSWEFLPVFDKKTGKEIDPQDPKNWDKIKTRGCLNMKLCQRVGSGHLNVSYHQRL